MWVLRRYLITAVNDGAHTTLRLNDADELDDIRRILGSDLVLPGSDGATYSLVAGGTLAGVPADGLQAGLAALTAPATIVLAAAGTEPDCGQDHVEAVNLTRPVPALDAAAVARHVAKAAAKYGGCRQVVLEHFLGGPCDPENIVNCVVPGGSNQGWTVVKELDAAIQLAHSRAVKRTEDQGELAGGQAVVVIGLKARPDLNGEVGILLRFDHAASRWLVRLRNGEGKRIKPANLAALAEDGNPAGGVTGRVLVFWGDAR